MAKRRMIIAILLLLSAGLLSAAESSRVQVTGTIDPAPLVTEDDIPLISDESTGLTVVARIYKSESEIGSNNVIPGLWISAISLKNLGSSNSVTLSGVNLMHDENHAGIESFALIYGIGGNTKDSVSASVTVSSVAWTKDNDKTDIKFNISSGKFDSSTTWYADVTDAEDNSGNDVITFHGIGNQQELVPVAYTYVTWSLDGVTVLPVGEYSATVEITVDGDG